MRNLVLRFFDLMSSIKVFETYTENLKYLQNNPKYLKILMSLENDNVSLMTENLKSLLLFFSKLQKKKKILSYLNRCKYTFIKTGKYQFFLFFFVDFS